MSVAPRERLAYRPAELAGLVGLSAKAIYRAIARGELRAAKIANGSRLLIPADAAEQWLIGDEGAPTARGDTGERPRRAKGGPLKAALSDLEESEGGG